MERHIRELEERCYINLVDLGLGYAKPINGTQSITDAELEKYFWNSPFMLGLHNRELMLKMYLNKTFYIDNIHYYKPEEVKQGYDVITHGCEYYGDPYAGCQKPQFLYNVITDTMIDNRETGSKKLTKLEKMKPAWFFIDEHTLVFIGNGSLYESFKDSSAPRRNFDEGIFSEKPGVITKVILLGSYSGVDYQKSVEERGCMFKPLGLDIDNFFINWTIPPLVVDIYDTVVAITAGISLCDLDKEGIKNTVYEYTRLEDNSLKVKTYEHSSLS